MTSFRILLIGDACIDEYRYGTVTRLNPEAPVPVLEFDREPMTAMGMVHNVDANLRAFGAHVDLVAPSVQSKKIRYIDSKTGYHLLRVDEDRGPSEPFTVKQVTDYKRYDAVVISDYDKGFVRDSLFEDIHKRFKGPIFVDTKKTHLPNLDRLIYKINQKEFNALASEIDPDKLVVTLGENGCYYGLKTYPSEQISVVDVCGAGDVFLAALAYGFLKTKSMGRAIEVANKAAAMSCAHMGVYTLNQEEVWNAFL